jgi:hypothetical protein
MTLKGLVLFQYLCAVIEENFVNRYKWKDHLQKKFPQKQKI